MRQQLTSKNNSKNNSTGTQTENLLIETKKKPQLIK